MCIKLCTTVKVHWSTLLWNVSIVTRSLIMISQENLQLKYLYVQHLFTFFCYLFYDFNHLLHIHVIVCYLILNLYLWISLLERSRHLTIILINTNFTILIINFFITTIHYCKISIYFNFSHLTWLQVLFSIQIVMSMLHGCNFIRIDRHY